MAEPGTGAFISMAALLALVVGGARIVIGLFRLGWMAFLLSQPVILGFTAAAALLIIGSQIPGAFGVEPSVAGVGPQALWTLLHPGNWDPTAMVISAVTLVLMFGSRWIHPAIPGVLLACVGGLIFSVVTSYEGPRLGAVPTNLPVPSLDLPWSRLPTLILPGIVIAMVGFAEAASISQALATRERRPWDPDREFISQGVANVAAGLFGGFPAGGSFSRTSLNHLAGARSRWSGFIAGLAVLLFVPFSSALAPLPRATLAAVVIAAVWKLIKIQPLLELWTLSRLQAVIGWATFAMTIFLAPHVEEAVILSVALAMGVHLWRELKPEYTVRKEGSSVHMELGGVLWFGSAPILEKSLLKSLDRAGEVETVVFDLGGLGRVDVTGALVLRQLKKNVERAGLAVRFTNAPIHAHRVLGEIVEWDPDVQDQGEPG
jgi:SulP family sulfate permease